MALALGITEWKHNATLRTYARELIQQMQITNRLAAENIKERHEKDAVAHAEKYHNIVYNVRQKVWLYWPPQVKPGQLKKLCNRWHNPYEITRVIGDVNYEIRDLTGTRCKIVQIMHMALLYGLP